MELELVAQGQGNVLGQHITLLFHLQQKVPEHQHTGRQEGDQHHVEGAGVGKAQFIEGELILQPAQKYAEGARARDVQTDLKRFLMHNPASVSIRFVKLPMILP